MYGHLDGEPIGADVLATRIGTSPRTIRRHLQRLAAFELATRVVDGWTRGEASLDEVARALGTAGRSEDRRERHRTERGHRLARVGRGRVDPLTGEIIEGRQRPTQESHPGVTEWGSNVPRLDERGELERAEAVIRAVFGTENVLEVTTA